MVLLSDELTRRFSFLLASLVRVTESKRIIKAIEKIKFTSRKTCIFALNQLILKMELAL